MRLRYISPARAVHDAGGALERVRALRGDVYYDGGRRPGFLDDAGQPVDADPLDPYGHHVVAECYGELVGCVRILPLDRCNGTLHESAIEREALPALLRANRLRRRDVVEASRLAVRPGTGGLIALKLVAGVSAVAGYLGAPLVVIATGARSGKHEKLFRRRRFTRVPDPNGVEMPEWDDHVIAMQRWVWPLDPIEVGVGHDLGLLSPADASQAAA